MQRDTQIILLRLISFVPKKIPEDGTPVPKRLGF